MTFTDEDKLAEINREIEMRRRVYSWQVRNGKISAEQARRQIDILIAIKLDYAAKLRSQQGHCSPFQRETADELFR